MIKRIWEIDHMSLKGRTVTFRSECSLLPRPVSGTVVEVKKEPSETLFFVRTDGGKVYTIGSNTYKLQVIL